MFGILFVLWFSPGPLANPWWRGKAPKKGNKSVFLLLQKDQKLLFPILIPIYSISGCSNRNIFVHIVVQMKNSSETWLKSMAKYSCKIFLCYIILRGIWKCLFQWIFSNAGTFVQITAYFRSFMAAVDNMDIYVTIH